MNLINKSVNLINKSMNLINVHRVFLFFATFDGCLQ